MAGKTNAQYTVWLNNVASEDCSLVGQLNLKPSNGERRTITDPDQISRFMKRATEAQISQLDEIIFSGSREGSTWKAPDDRLTNNLERVDNDGDVPIHIKRPPGT